MWAWTDNQGNPEDALTLDEMLDNIMLYWLPGNATSSARLYWESVANVAPTKLANVASTRLELPVGVSIYPRETNRRSRRWVDRRAGLTHRSAGFRFFQADRIGHAIVAWSASFHPDPSHAFLCTASHSYLEPPPLLNAVLRPSAVKPFDELRSRFRTAILTLRAASDDDPPG